MVDLVAVHDPHPRGPRVLRRPVREPVHVDRKSGVGERVGEVDDGTDERDVAQQPVHDVTVVDGGAATAVSIRDSVFERHARGGDVIGARLRHERRQTPDELGARDPTRRVQRDDVREDVDEEVGALVLVHAQQHRRLLEALLPDHVGRVVAKEVAVDGRHERRRNVRAVRYFPHGGAYSPRVVTRYALEDVRRRRDVTRVAIEDLGERRSARPGHRR